MNTVVLTGRLTADVELKKTPQQISVCQFTVAVDRRAGGKQSADFIRIEAWRSTAEFVCKYFHKGDGIEIVGSLATETYKDREGKNVSRTYVVASNVGFTISNKKAAKTAENDPYEGFDTGTTKVVDEDNLPF